MHCVVGYMYYRVAMCTIQTAHALQGGFLHYRGDLVSIKTWFQRDGRIAFERNWEIKNAATGERLGTATRYTHLVSFLFLPTLDLTSQMKSHAHTRAHTHALTPKHIHTRRLMTDFIGLPDRLDDRCKASHQTD